MSLRSPSPALLTAILFVVAPAASASAEQKCTQLATSAFRDAKLLKIARVVPQRVRADIALVFEVLEEFV